MSEDFKYGTLVDSYNSACALVDKLADEFEAMSADPENHTQAELDKKHEEFTGACQQRDKLHEELRSKEALEKAREQHKPIVLAGKTFQVKEPDIYRQDNSREISFFTDLYWSQNGDPTARDRIEKHQRHELEKFAVTSSTVGGLIPPAYLLDLYAKASRNGRVFADQVNNQALPDVGMNVILPRITTPLAAGVQATENTAATTQDPAETDLTVPVRTLAGYSPVSRQALERGAYSDRVLFEDLIARYWALLDSQCLSGSGSSGQILGVLNTSSIATSTASTATVPGVWPKIADVIQQIGTNMGGIGYVATKIFMHPRRWGFFQAALDSSNRPLMPSSAAEPSFNVVGLGNESGYGLVGQMHGCNIYVDANIPTNLGTNTNEDRIIVIADPVVHLFERNNDPVTLSFEQQAGTSLQVQLIVYGYAAFTAGRYPGASGVVSGAGLVPPTF